MSKVLSCGVFLLLILCNQVLAEGLSANWYLEQIGTHELRIDAAEERPFMQLDEVKKRVEGYDGCNRFHGTFEMTEGRMVFGALAATRRMCDERVSAIEQEFYQGLNRHDQFKLNNNQLLLFKNGQQLLQFISK